MSTTDAFHLGQEAHFPQLEEEDSRTHQPSRQLLRKVKEEECPHLTRMPLLTSGTTDRGFFSDDAQCPAPFTLFP